MSARAASRAAALASSAAARELAAAAAATAAPAARGAGLTLSREAALRGRHGTLCVGIDEAGRGPLAGPVVAAAVALMHSDGPPPVAGVRDSKTVPEAEREALAAALRACGGRELEFALSVVPVETIDSVNILQATLRGMEAALAAVTAQVAARRRRGGGGDGGPLYVLIDGPIVPGGIAAAAGGGSAAAAAAAAASDAPAVRFVEPVIKGDSKVWCIAAASLLAKAHRDAIMRELDAAHPQYGFALHKGYGVRAHMEALRRHGPCAAHRTTFEPIKSMLASAAPAAAPAPAAASDAAGAAGGKRKRAAAAAAAAPTGGAAAPRRRAAAPPPLDAAAPPPPSARKRRRA